MTEPLWPGNTDQEIIAKLRGGVAVQIEELASMAERMEAQALEIAKLRKELTNDACGDALEKLWQEIIVARRPKYGDWEYPGQAYRHLKAEYDELRKQVAALTADNAALLQAHADEVKRLREALGPRGKARCPECQGTGEVEYTAGVECLCRKELLG